MVQEQVGGAFASRVGNLLERVEYRRADTAEDKDVIFRMRYEAYSREGYIEPNSTGMFTDPDDNAANAWLIAVFIDGALAASLRLHIAARPKDLLPAVKVFPDILLPRLAAGEMIVDCSRMTSRLEFTRAYPFLPYITMRSAFLAEEHFGADYITAAIRPEYQSVYRRMYGAANWSAPRPYPLMTRPQALMAYDCKGMRRATHLRYPFEDSTAEQRAALYGRSSNGWVDPYAERMTGRDSMKRETRQQSTTSAA